VRTIDAYTLRRIAKPFAVVLCLLIGIFVLVDLFDHAHSFIDNDVRIGIILRYYLCYLPYIVVLTSPIAMLLATLLAIGGLSRRNELMALKGSGVSLYRILAPVLVLAAVVSLCNVLIGEVVLPEATRERLKIKETSISRKASEVITVDPIYVTPDGTMFLARRLNSRTKTLEEVTVETFDETSRPTTRIDAASAVWEDGRWVFYDGSARTFSGSSEKVRTFERFASEYREPSPGEMDVRKLEPDEMAYRELRAYIVRLRASGNDPLSLAVQLQLKIAFPLVVIIMTLLGATLAAGSRRSGFAVSFAAALAVSFFYFGVLQVGQVLGRQGILAPWLAAWVSNIIFAGVGVWLLVRAPK
jgi:lipopolysaccharide export system permease protein